MSLAIFFLLPIAEYARVQFKEYVNTLASIRQEENDKYLVLKPIFYPSDYLDPSYNSVGLPLPPYVPQQYAPPPLLLDAAPAFRAPPPYRPPPEPVPFRRSSGSDLSINQPPPPVVNHFIRQTSLPSDDFIPASAYLMPQQQPMPERSVSIQDFTSHLVQDLTRPLPVVPPRRLKSQRCDDKENNSASIGSSCSSIDGSGGGLANEEIKISVKERTQRFNKMASEIDLAPKNGGQDRRDHKSKVINFNLHLKIFI